VSGEFVNKLKIRARVFLSEAEHVSNNDLAMFFIEQAIQLYIKAIYYELFGDLLRTHKLREMLGLLAKSLEIHEFNQLAEKLFNFVDENRRLLARIEEAYTMGRYGDVEYTRDDVEKALSLAKELIKLLEEISRCVKLG